MCEEINVLGLWVDGRKCELFMFGGGNVAEISMEIVIIVMLWSTIGTLSQRKKHVLVVGGGHGKRQGHQSVANLGNFVVIGGLYGASRSRD